MKYSLTQLYNFNCCSLICKYFISSFNLVMVALCCVNLDAGEVFGILILAKWGIILLRRHLWLIYTYILALQLYIILFHFIHPFIPLACAACDNSLPFSGASSIPVCYVLLLTTLLHQLFFHPLSLHLAIYFLVYLSILLFPNSFIIRFWEFYFLPFSVHSQTNIIYLTLLSLLYRFFNPCINFFIGYSF
jgi:hypothetical protein